MTGLPDCLRVALRDAEKVQEANPERSPTLPPRTARDALAELTLALRRCAAESRPVCRTPDIGRRIMQCFGTA